MSSDPPKEKEIQSQEFVLHISDIPLDVKESDIVEYFKKELPGTEFKV